MPRAEQKTAWCFGCGKKQPYKVFAGTDITLVDGRRVAYQRYDARCAECGRAVDVEWVNDLNYRKEVEARDYAKRCGAVADR